MATQSKNMPASKVIQVRKLTDSTAVVRIERQGLEFVPGQYVRIGVEGDPEIRDYSIYSGVQADYLEVLVRRIEDGLVSKQLFDLTAGETVSLSGPYGHFKCPVELHSKPLLFLATGTGISPFHCFVESYPGLSYRLLHGTAFLAEGYDAHAYGDSYTHCVSREDGGAFRGRITDYLKTFELSPDTEVFLCGNCDMIYAGFDLLKERGFPISQLHTEVYF